MGTSDLLRHQIIRSLPLLQTERIPDAAVLIWEQMAAQIISIVGEGGFNVALLEKFDPCPVNIFPGSSSTRTQHRPGTRFAELKTCLERQTPEHASAANLLLLITFTDILASLIGESLTTRILRLAWGYDAANSAGKETK